MGDISVMSRMIATQMMNESCHAVQVSVMLLLMIKVTSHMIDSRHMNESCHTQYTFVRDVIINDQSHVTHERVTAHMHQ